MPFLVGFGVGLLGRRQWGRRYEVCFGVYDQSTSQERTDSHPLPSELAGMITRAAATDSPGPGVVIACLSTRFGGADVRVLQTARGLRRRGWRHAVAVVAGSPLERMLREEGLPAHPVAAFKRDPRIVPSLSRLVTATGATVIDAHNPQSQYFAGLAALARGIPRRIATVHSLYDDASESPPQRLYGRGALRMSRLIGASFVAVSGEIREDLLGRGVPPHRILLSRNGIEPLANAPQAADLRAGCGWPSDAVVVAVIGRLVPRKGHAVLFEALAALSREGNRRLHVVVAGEGSEEGPLRAQAEALGISDRVHFAGFVSDVPALLAGLDFVCVPSLMEGLPYIILEACRQAVPVLSSRVGETAHLFDDGRNIAFSPPGDAAALARRLRFFTDHPEERARIGRAARHFVESELSVRNMVDETLTLYRGADAFAPTQTHLREGSGRN